MRLELAISVSEMAGLGGPYGHKTPDKASDECHLLRSFDFKQHSGVINEVPWVKIEERRCGRGGGGGREGVRGKEGGDGAEA